MDNSTSLSLYDYALKRLEESPLHQKAKAEPVELSVKVGDNIYIDAEARTS